MRGWQDVGGVGAAYQHDLPLYAGDLDNPVSLVGLVVVYLDDPHGTWG